VLRTHDYDEQLPDELARLLTLDAPVVQGRACPQTRTAHDGNVLDFRAEHVRALATPGHAPHCRSIVWREHVFCGGMLTALACPHHRVAGNPAALWGSVTPRLFTLPYGTLLFVSLARRAQAVGTVFKQRLCHPWLARRCRDTFVAHMSSLARLAAASPFPHHEHTRSRDPL